MATPLPDLDAEEEAAIKNTVLEDFSKNYEDFMEAQAVVYENLMSDQAVNDSIDFYTSSSGEEIVRIMPEINEQIARLSKELAKKTMVAFLKLTDDDSFWRPPEE